MPLGQRTVEVWLEPPPYARAAAGGRLVVREAGAVFWDEAAAQAPRPAGHAVGGRVESGAAVLTLGSGQYQLRAAFEV